MSEAVRNVVVIGGAGGIGQAIALRFAQGGSQVHLLGRDDARLAAAAAALSAHSALAALHRTCDLSDPHSVAEAFAAIPRIDVLVNAAGAIARKPLADTRPADWRGAWSDKVLGTIEACRLACETMRASGGVIVNIMGTAGVRLNPKTIMTSTANAALIAFTQAIGAQSVDWGVRVVGINPGLTATPRTQDLAAGRGGDSYKSQLADMPFGRMAHASEIAECAWFLASPQAAYISGTVIDVDAGARWRG